MPRTLLTATDTTGTAVSIPGGQYALEGVDVGTNDVTLQRRAQDGSTWYDTDLVLPNGTASNIVWGNLPQGTYRGYVSVAGPQAWLVPMSKR